MTVMAVNERAGEINWVEAVELIDFAGLLLDCYYFGLISLLINWFVVRFKQLTLDFDFALILPIVINSINLLSSLIS